MLGYTKPIGLCKIVLNSRLTCRLHVDSLLENRRNTKLEKLLITHGIVRMTLPS